MSLIKRLSVAVTYLAFCCSNTVHAQPSRQDEALRSIREFALEVCRTVNPSGKSDQIKVAAELRAGLPGLLKKLVNLGFDGGAEYQTQSYEGLLQKDLASMLRNEMQCRQTMAEKLIEKLIVSPAPAQRTLAPGTKRTPPSSFAKPPEASSVPIVSEVQPTSSSNVSLYNFVSLPKTTPTNTDLLAGSSPQPSPCQALRDAYGGLARMALSDNNNDSANNSVAVTYMQVAAEASGGDAVLKEIKARSSYSNWQLMSGLAQDRLLQLHTGRCHGEVFSVPGATQGTAVELQCDRLAALRRSLASLYASAEGESVFTAKNHLVDIYNELLAEAKVVLPMDTITKAKSKMYNRNWYFETRNKILVEATALQDRSTLFAESKCAEKQTVTKSPN